MLVESFRPGLMASWGLDGDALRAAGNPGLVSCSVTAFGTGEAGRGLPGYDFLLQAMGGLMHVTGEPDGPPVKVGAAVVDLSCGLLAANGVQAALLERARTGRGRHVEVSLMDAALTSLLNQGSAWVAGGVAGTRRGNRHPSIVPYETFDAADRPLAIAVGNDRLFARLCEALGLAEPGRRRALRHQRRTRRAPRRAVTPARRGDRARAGRALGRGRCAPRRCPSGRSTAIDEAFALAEELGMEPIASARRRPAGAPAPAGGRRAAADPPRPARARRARRGDPGLAAGPVERLEPPSEAAHGSLSADRPENLSERQRAGALPLI